MAEVRNITIKIEGLEALEKFTAALERLGDDLAAIRASTSLAKETTQRRKVKR